MVDVMVLGFFVEVFGMVVVVCNGVGYGIVVGVYFSFW